MKKLLAFLLLISHMNTSMFLPQVPESDVFDAGGNQVDDVNSVVEFIMVKLGVDHRADDEDDDNGQNLHLVKITELFFQPAFSEPKNNEFTVSEQGTFSEYKENKISLISYDIIIPPPKFQA